MLIAAVFAILMTVGAAPTTAHAITYACAIASAQATTDDGTLLIDQVPAMVVKPGTTITVNLVIDPIIQPCPGGGGAASFQPDGRQLERPWLEAGRMEYSVRVPSDLKGGVSQRLVITTREELGAVPVFSIGFRTANDDPPQGSATIGAPVKFVDGKMIPCDEHPEVCWPSPSPTPDEALPAAPAAAAPPPAAPENAAPDIVAAPDSPAPEAPAPAASASPTTFSAPLVAASAPPGWLWPGIGVAATLGIFVAAVVAMARRRDHLARLRRMAEHD